MIYPSIPKMSMVAIISLGSLLVCAGCSKSDSGGSGSGGGTGSTNGGGTPAPVSAIRGTGDADAVNAVQVALQKSWVQIPDGWITEFTAPQDANLGPMFYEFKELTFEVKSDDLSDANKQDGFQFHGSVTLTNPTYRSCAKLPWGEWTAFNAEFFAVQKYKGEWQVLGNERFPDTKGFLLDGTKPDESTLAALK